MCVFLVCSKCRSLKCTFVMPMPARLNHMLHYHQHRAKTYRKAGLTGMSSPLWWTDNPSHRELGVL